MSNENDYKKSNNFSSAMGDLKGLLDKEGINLNLEINSEDTPSSADTSPDLLDIDIPLISNEVPQPELPILNGTITIVDENNSDSSQTNNLDNYISDFAEDGNELRGFADSIQELEEKVEAITDPEHLHLYKQSEAKNVQLKHLKASLHLKLTMQIETSVDELKTKLLNSMESEINNLFENLSQK